MRRTLVLITLLCATAHAASTSTPSIQNVRFAQESGPSNLVTPPKLLTHPAAVYTDEARRRGVQGNVIVQAYFDTDGNITVLKVIKGLGYGLDENALASVKQWRFSPALRNGLPVSAVAEIEVPFRLVNVEELEKLRKALNEAQQELLLRVHDDIRRAHDQ